MRPFGRRPPANPGFSPGVAAASARDTEGGIAKLLKDLYNRALQTADEEEYDALKKSLKTLVRRGGMERQLCSLVCEKSALRVPAAAAAEGAWLRRGKRVLDLMDEFFMRSKAFRAHFADAMKTRMEPFVQQVGLTAREVALRNAALLKLEKWDMLFGQSIPQIHVLYRYYKEVRRVAFPLGAEEEASAEAGRALSSSRLVYEGMVRKHRGFLAEVRSLVEEMEGAMELLVPVVGGARTRDAPERAADDDEDDDIDWAADAGASDGEGTGENGATSSGGSGSTGPGGDGEDGETGDDGDDEAPNFADALFDLGITEDSAATFQLDIDLSDVLAVGRGGGDDQEEDGALPLGGPGGGGARGAVGEAKELLLAGVRERLAVLQRRYVPPLERWQSTILQLREDANRGVQPAEGRPDYLAYGFLRQQVPAALRRAKDAAEMAASIVGGEAGGGGDARPAGAAGGGGSDGAAAAVGKRGRRDAAEEATKGAPRGSKKRRSVRERIGTLSRRRR